MDEWPRSKDAAESEVATAYLPGGRGRGLFYCGQFSVSVALWQFVKVFTM